jgi:hypothetical protein
VKEAFMVKLDGADAEWVERQAVVFGSRSLVLRVLVRVMRSLIASGTLRWELAELQSLLLRNRSDRGNRVPLPTPCGDGEPGRFDESADLRPLRGVSTTRRQDVAAREEMEAWNTAFLGTHIFPRFATESLRP